jgi:hypothetical protein
MQQIAAVSGAVEALVQLLGSGPVTDLVLIYHCLAVLSRIRSSAPPGWHLSE